MVLNQRFSAPPRMTGGFKLKRNDSNINQLKIYAIDVDVWQKPKQWGCKSNYPSVKDKNMPQNQAYALYYH